ncbi:hypothetical protein [Bacillus sp. AK031]
MITYKVAAVRLDVVNESEEIDSYDLPDFEVNEIDEGFLLDLAMNHNPKKYRIANLYGTYSKYENGVHIHTEDRDYEGAYDNSKLKLMRLSIYDGDNIIELVNHYPDIKEMYDYE